MPDIGCGVDRGVSTRRLGYSDTEERVLAIARYYFDTFARPEHHSWIAALSGALDAIDNRHGPDESIAVLSAVQAMRRSRQSVFRFNNPDCGVCAQYVTPHERAFMASLRAIVRIREDAATAHAALPCEGNDTRDFLAALKVLSEFAVLSPVMTRPASGSHTPSSTMNVRMVSRRRRAGARDPTEIWC